MNCPHCHDENVRRSRRKGLLDLLLAQAGIVAWRCANCVTRFHARVVPLQNLLHAHCAICGNVDLKSIAPKFVPGVGAFFGRLFRFPALRCEPCRHKFFSVRPKIRVEPG